MLSDNMKKMRKQKGLSQEEFAEKLNVVRQTVSKWENGLSVPDAEILIRIADELDTDVSVLLDTTIKNCDDSKMKVIAERLESINIKLEKQKETQRKVLRIIFIVIFAIAIVLLISSLISILYYKIMFNNITADATVIGGYNGPTNIFVYDAKISKSIPLVAIFIAIVSAFGLYKTKNN